MIVGWARAWHILGRCFFVCVCPLLLIRVLLAGSDECRNECFDCERISIGRISIRVSFDSYSRNIQMRILYLFLGVCFCVRVCFFLHVSYGTSDNGLPNKNTTKYIFYIFFFQSNVFILPAYPKFMHVPGAPNLMRRTLDYLAFSFSCRFSSMARSCRDYAASHPWRDHVASHPWRWICFLVGASSRICANSIVSFAWNLEKTHDFCPNLENNPS